MRYGPRLRHLLVGYQPRVEHVYLLESFQLAQVVTRIGLPRIAALVQYDPTLRRVLVLKQPDLAEPLAEALEQVTLTGEDPADALWEIADLLVYNADPALYDAAMPAPPVDTLQELLPDGGVLADVGAGTGRLALRVAPRFERVHAVEPVGAMRGFLRRQRDRLGTPNLIVQDGFLDDLPLPDDAVDALVTRSALGWRLPRELEEIARVVRPGGRAVHLTGLPVDADVGGLHQALVHAGYTMSTYLEGRSPCRAYRWVRPGLRAPPDP